MTTLSLGMQICSFTECVASLLPFLGYLEQVGSSVIAIDGIFHLVWSSETQLSECENYENCERSEIIDRRKSCQFLMNKKTPTHPNNEPKNPFDEFNFFSASAINCNAFCSLSAIIFTEIYKFSLTLNHKGKFFFPKNRFSGNDYFFAWMWYFKRSLIFHDQFTNN